MNKNLLAFTGAGISKESGIPTFDEMGDLRNKLSRKYFNRHPKAFFNILLKLKNKVDKASPNNAHLALTKYDIPIMTMNIDGLHTKAGSKDVLEIHGNLRKLTCKKCNKEYDYSVLNNGYSCPNCCTVLQSQVVLYGDGLDKMEQAFSMIKESDILIVVGTSYYTSTAVDIYRYAKALNKEIFEINSNASVMVPRLLKKLIRA